MTFSFPRHTALALPILAGLTLADAPAIAQQQFYGGSGYGTSAVGAYNPYTQSGPGSTSGRPYGAAPVAPYPPAYGPATAQSPPPSTRPSAAPGGPRVPYTAAPPAGQVGAYNPWRPQPVGGYAPETGSRPPAFYAPYGSYSDAEPGANLPPPPPGPIRSRILSVPEVGTPQGPAVPFQSVPYTPRRSGAVRPAAASRTNVAAAPAPTPAAVPAAPQIASAGTATDSPPPPSLAPTPRVSSAKPPEAKPAPAVMIERPTRTTTVTPAPPVMAAKPPETPKPAPAPVVVAARPPEAPAPKPAPLVAAKPPEAAPPSPIPPPPVIDKPVQTAAVVAPPPSRAPAGGSARIAFDANSPALSDHARGTLDALAVELMNGPSRRTTLKAYSAGGGGPDTRRMSLARGLAVRAYLIDKGVPKDRLDVQALGASADGGPADRVDIIAGTGT